MKGEFLIAITQLAAERKLPREVVLGAVEAALVSAFKKDQLAESDLLVRINPASGELKLYVRKTVVEGPLEDPQHQISLEEARRVRVEAQAGQVVELEAPPASAGRIAAQTTKQVVLQRLREAERELVYAEYAGKEGELVSGVVQRLEGRSVIVDLGRAEALLPSQEQAPGERYRAGQRGKFYILEVGKSPKGPQIVLSRTHKDLLRRLFELEVPELYNGLVEIKAIAREPGYRSKVAVAALQERVDAVGSCVGLRGMRIQNIVNELHGEKIDVVEWVAEPGAFIAKALGPAQVMKVLLQPVERIAVAVVPERQISLAIGREGQNARLAAKLTGWRIDIKSTTEAEAEQMGRPLPALGGTAPAAVAAPSAAAPAPVVVAPAAASAPAPVPVAEALPAGEGVEVSPSAEGEEAAPAKEAEAPAVAEAPSLVEALARADTWRVPQSTVPRSPIRFAEDIAEYRNRSRGRGRRGGRGGEEEGGKGRKGRQDQPTVPTEEPS